MSAASSASAQGNFVPAYSTSQSVRLPDGLNNPHSQCLAYADVFFQQALKKMIAERDAELASKRYQALQNFLVDKANIHALSWFKAKHKVFENWKIVQAEIEKLSFEERGRLLYLEMLARYRAENDEGEPTADFIQAEMEKLGIVTAKENESGEMEITGGQHALGKSVKGFAKFRKTQQGWEFEASSLKLAGEMNGHFSNYQQAAEDEDLQDINETDNNTTANTQATPILTLESTASSGAGTKKSKQAGYELPKMDSEKNPQNPFMKLLQRMYAPMFEQMLPQLFGKIERIVDRAETEVLGGVLKMAAEGPEEDDEDGQPKKRGPLDCEDAIRETFENFKNGLHNTKEFFGSEPPKEPKFGFAKRPTPEDEMETPDPSKNKGPSF